MFWIIAYNLIVLNAWLQFLISAFIILIAGSKLAGYGDIIARRTGLGGVWLGSILIAAITSMPELSTSISASIIKSPDIAIGNIFGSNIFNMIIIALSDLAATVHPILSFVSPIHILTAAFGMLLSALGAVFVLARLPFSIFGVGVDSLIILFTYLFGVKLLFEKTKGGISEEAKPGEMSLGQAYLGFIICAIAVIGAGIWLSISGSKLAVLTRLGETFIGSTLVAMSTSLPEVVVSISAASIGAYDIAIGNVLGSNIFNMVIIAASDIAYRGGPILSNISSAHAITALLGLILSSMVVVALFYKSKRTILNIGIDSWLIVLTYLLGLYFLFLRGLKL